VSKSSVRGSQPEDNHKFIGVRIDMELYWLVRAKLVEKQMTMSKAITQGLLKILDIKSPPKSSKILKSIKK